MFFFRDRQKSIVLHYIIDERNIFLVGNQYGIKAHFLVKTRTINNNILDNDTNIKDYG